MRILVTGGAGFIGHHSTLRLLAEGHELTILDNLNEYYEVSLKKARLQNLPPGSNFTFVHADITDYPMLLSLLKDKKIECIVHLAAMVGVRYSLEHGHDYVRTNIEGTYNVFEAARHAGVAKIVYASSSSVYGAEPRLPWSEDMSATTPLSLYGATKRATELIAYQYHHNFKIPSIGLRFFTVYGPWGRPDMAPFRFTRGILEGRPIDVYNGGKMKRDFTYIDDIVDGVMAAIAYEASYEIFNLGNGHQVELMNFLAAIEKGFGKKAQINFMPLQPGDFVESHADISKASRLLGYKPRVAVEIGVAQFCEWYKSFYNV